MFSKEIVFISSSSEDEESNNKIYSVHVGWNFEFSFLGLYKQEKTIRLML